MEILAIGVAGILDLLAIYQVWRSHSDMRTFNLIGLVIIGILCLIAIAILIL